MRITILAAALAVVLTSMTYAQDGSVVSGIRADKERYGLGETIRITFAVENRGEQPITYHFTSGQQFDLWALQDGQEVWRWSIGRFFIQALTSFTLQPNERKTFEAEWDQRDNEGRQVAPGTYNIWGELTVANTRPPAVSRPTAIGRGPAIVTTTVGGAVSRMDTLLNRVVSVEATYRGQRPDPEDPACRPGPPVTRSDWAIQDRTGCIYVTGPTALNPVDDIGTRVRVLGIVRRTEQGQPYIELESLTVLPPS